MKAFDGCDFRNVAVNDAKCFAGVTEFERKSAAITRYWETKVWSTGGTASTKNKEEQTNYKEALWVLEGAVKGLNELYPERFNEDGSPAISCTAADGKVSYGDEACTSVINAYVAAQGPSAPCKGKEACDAAIECY
jgi:hypothetical protein